MAQATLPLEALIIPLLSLSNQDKRWIADRLYKELENDNEHVQTVDFSTMPGQFTEEEKQQRLTEAYNSSEAYTPEEIKEMLLAI